MMFWYLMQFLDVHLDTLILLFDINFFFIIDFRANIFFSHMHSFISCNFFYGMSVVKYMRTIKESRHTSTKYAVWMFTQKQFGKLFEIGMWPSFKEFTECASGFHAVMYAADPHIRSNKNVVCYCIGDGHRPQMASMVASLTAWNRIFSIDPLLSINKWKEVISPKIDRKSVV